MLRVQSYSLIRNFTLRTFLERTQSLSQVSVVTHADPIFIETCPGSRILKLSTPEQSNYLSFSSIGMMKSSLSRFDNNNTISAIFFASASPEMFSAGINKIDLRENSSILFEEIQNFVETLASSKKATLAVFDGMSNATAYSLFAGSKYLLGSTNTEIVVNELSDGILPCAGMAFRFARGCQEGVEAARYFGVTAQPIYGSDAFALGLVGHLVQEESYTTLTNVIAHTIAPDAMKKSRQPSSADISELDELLDSMHGGGTMDVMDDPVWNEVMLVPPSEEPDVFASLPLEVENVTDIAKDMAHCFSPNAVEEVVSRLRAKVPEGQPDHWAARAIRAMAALDPLVVKAWFRLTRLAERGSLHAVMAMEARVNTRLLERPTVVPTVDQSVTDEELVRRLRTVSDVAVDALFLPAGAVVFDTSSVTAANSATAPTNVKGSSPVAKENPSTPRIKKWPRPKNGEDV